MGSYLVLKSYLFCEIFEDFNIQPEFSPNFEIHSDPWTGI